MEKAIGLAVVVVVMAGLIALASRVAFVRRARKTQTLLTAELMVKPLFCFCGQPAVRPPSRTGLPRWIDDILPVAWQRHAKYRYKPRIDPTEAPTLCASHGRAWDARLAAKLVQVVDLAEAEMYQRVADSLAGYEGGDLGLVRRQNKP